MSNPNEEKNLKKQTKISINTIPKDKSQEKSFNTYEQEAAKPLNSSIFSSKKPIKKLRAWCADCYQFFEFSPFAKVCLQHVQRKNCNVFACRKKLINPSLSKQCIRKFANVNSENRHTYCVEETEMLTWDPKLKIQNCFLIEENKKNSKNYFSSSSEKNRKNSFDSIKFSDLNLDLPENSELLFDSTASNNFNNNINNFANNNLFGSVSSKNNLSSNYYKNNNNENDKKIYCFSEKNKFHLSGSSSFYLNKKKINNNISRIKNDNFAFKNKKAFVFRSPSNKGDNSKMDINENSNKNKIHFAKAQLRNNSKEFTIKNEKEFDLKLNNSKEKENEEIISEENVNKFINKNYNKHKSKYLIVKNKSSNENSFETKDCCKRSFKKLTILRMRRKSKADFNKKLIKKQEKIASSSHSQFIAQDLNNFLILNSKNNNNNYDINESNKNKNNQNNINQEIFVEEEKESEVKEQSKEGFVNVNVNGLIDQIGNLKFENPINDSILEDEILIRQFDNIYFNYNRNKTECEILSLNDSNLELPDAKNIRIEEEDFDFLNSSNLNFNLYSNCNKNININNNFNNNKNSKFSIFKSDFKKADFDLNLNLNLLGIDENNNEVKKKEFFANKQRIENSPNKVFAKCISGQNAFLSSENKRSKVIIEENIFKGEAKKSVISQREKDEQEINEYEKYFNSSLVNGIINSLIENTILISINNNSTNEINNLNKPANALTIENQILSISSSENPNKNNQKPESLCINKITELNFSAAYAKQKNIFQEANLKLEKTENLLFEPLNINKIKSNSDSSKSEAFKIPDDSHLDEIMQLVRDNTGIPTKVLGKLKDSMKKKGIFNARVLRLFKKKKQGWNFIKKDFAKNCPQIEAICICLEELLEG